ncbi:hypothetical protein [Photobacterium galatheae]|uniref:Uncharacterized protein n=1 Tax=Photobacterium galatheae TaxID=1654360 RepID=A0A066RLG5_9GAMM|nr:hypothetical protein [Photobacterium galatheae]KDM89981.1 hypothetical protein EA58_19750 [Photobacterium galatheae]MCM0149225.1 hypothetical protein [Photobacterium galatheae]
MGIGFSLIFAGQDYQAFKKGSEEEAASIRSNCATKICMCLEDATETADIFVDGAGEDYDQVETGLEREGGMFGSKFVKKKEISYEKRKRIDVLDLKDQAPGEFHLLNMATLIRGRSFYANPAKPKELRVNTFVRVKPPAYNEVHTTKKGLIELKKRFAEVKRTNKKLTNLWKSHVDEDNKDLSKNLTCLANKAPLTQAAFALALRKNAIDQVDQTMALTLKELESVADRQLTSGEDFTGEGHTEADFIEEETFEKVTASQLEESANRLTLNETPKEKLQRIVQENEQVILNEVDLDANPLISFDVELDYATETIESLSHDIIQRWKSKGLIHEETFVVCPDVQANLAYAASQALILSGINFKKVLEKEQNEIE